MQDNLLSIGKMAEMNHLTVAALRLYDEMNLLKPRLIDPTSGYRYYDISQNARLDMIAYMKELGMSLAEIQDVLEKEDIAQIETILVKKNEQLYEEMRLLRAKHHAVERAITSIERYRKSPTKGTISLEYIERRYYWGQKCKINFYEKDLDAYEEVLLSLRKELIDVGFSQIHSYNIGTSIDKEDYLLAIERSPVKTVEIKELLKNPLTNDINNREVYMKGIDHSYYYEGYAIYKAEDL